MGLAHRRNSWKLLPMRNRSLTILCAFAPALWGADFQTDVLPILKQNCYKCHGNGKTKGDLSLEVDDIGNHIGREKPISPGEVEKSRIIQLINGVDGDRMPLKGRPLTELEIAKITEWVKEGAGLGKGTPFAENNKKALATGEWTNAEGRAIKADLLGVEEGKALLRVNEKVHRVPLEKLSEESQKRIKEAMK